MPPTLREGLLARPLPRFTDRTITGASMLRAELEAVVGQGYGVTVEELELGLAAVAAPVRAHDGKVIAAISVWARCTGSTRTGCRRWPSVRSRRAPSCPGGWGTA